ncbi:MAG: ATP-dependent DNA helicase RecG [Candidatus Woykebacteria bacterium RBG_16_44_10]|uniref:Probable DNA 3'-5' helicase RecG n=1 Tax=Candidatus Woykebacteria bacterium RBG_16_44_10 TaxID=1802597 RepID=A0A1G1WFI7_9BACT|nr:MAG: ATP-dependent DNA helicase RecG [Candidatus Woykebacteria bacterium RBG_16_44_10]
MSLQAPIEQVPSVGKFYANRLHRLKISTIEDLVYHYPFRYENLGIATPISEIGLGGPNSAAGEVWQIRNVRTRFGKNLTLATVNDGTASIEAVWFNQPFLTKVIKAGSKISLAGRVDLFSHRVSFINPEYELIDAKARKKSLHTQGLVPVYPETAGVSSKWLRSKIMSLLPAILPKIEDPLPSSTLKSQNLIPKRQAIWQIHFPTDENQINEAKKRLSFEELLISQLIGLDRKNAWEKNQKGFKMSVTQEKLLSLIGSLPFSLTDAQRRVIKEILDDISKEKPMNRLLQGDVGSGKTVVAAAAAYSVFLNGYQSALMAPTEILALQHFKTFSSVLKPLGVKVSLRTSSTKNNEPFDILVGTHALINHGAVFKKLAFAVIDEQHRFGVEQRARLRHKGKTPHVLTMTATPIPRSLALTLYGDLEVSSLDELPKDRKIVKTFVVPPEKRVSAYQFIRDNISKGRQAFIIFPFIEPSETLSSVKAAKKEYEYLKKEVFPDLSIGLLHGRLKLAEKKDVLERFSQNKLNILVSTPIVEVGIDIPNATIMLIEGAERFGLASLHQLRGRVGRGAEQSYCFLFSESSSPNVLQRLSALEKYHLGLKLAEIDLKMRGPGEIYGTAQSGIPSFKIASLTDLPLIKATREEAVKLFNSREIEKLTVLKSEVKRQSLVPPD